MGNFNGDDTKHLPVISERRLEWPKRVQSMDEGADLLKSTADLLWNTISFSDLSQYPLPRAFFRKKN